MKVKCMSKGYFDNVTIGKYYSGIRFHNTWVVVNDKQKVCTYPTIYFMEENSVCDTVEKFKRKRMNVCDLSISNTSKEPKHYDNSKGSLYQFAENHNLNAYEFDIIKRVVRSRKKGNFKEDLEKTKFLIDLYLKEWER